MRTRTGMLAALWLGLVVAACNRGGPANGPQYPLTNSGSTPAAQGNVYVDTGPNGNTRVAINVRHLAPPSSITPMATTYVAWIVPGADQPPINAGAIEVDAELKGTLETITPHRQFEVIITPEASAVAMRPSNKPVLTARVQNI